MAGILHIISYIMDFIYPVLHVVHISGLIGRPDLDTELQKNCRLKFLIHIVSCSTW